MSVDCRSITLARNFQHIAIGGVRFCLILLVGDGTWSTRRRSSANAVNSMKWSFSDPTIVINIRWAILSIILSITLGKFSQFSAICHCGSPACWYCFIIYPGLVFYMILMHCFLFFTVCASIKDVGWRCRVVLLIQCRHGLLFLLSRRRCFRYQLITSRHCRLSCNCSLMLGRHWWRGLLRNRL